MVTVLDIADLGFPLTCILIEKYLQNLENFNFSNQKGNLSGLYPNI